MENDKSTLQTSLEANDVIPEKISGSGSSGTSALLAALFNGMGVGLLLGLLLGLAVSPVVSAFIGTLSSLLILLIGLKETYFNTIKSVRIGAFGVFAVVGILSGLYIRSHNPLAPSLNELQEEYKALGYSEKEANNFIVYQEFGLIPPEWKDRLIVSNEASATDKDGKNEKGKTPMMADRNQINMAKRNNVLFSSTVQIGECRMLETSRADMPFNKIKRNFTNSGGTWKELAENIDPDVPEQARVDALLAVRDVICNLTQESAYKIKCIDFGDSLHDMPLKELKSELQKADPFWDQCLTILNEKIDKKHQHKVIVSLVNVLCHE
ncbi:MAG: hypothetical protein KDC05_12575 [Bacteroidales bacterium]|nr:hypothetical protein [Bacteroidales bacterium]